MRASASGFIRVPPPCTDSAAAGIDMSAPEPSFGGMHSGGGLSRRVGSSSELVQQRRNRFETIAVPTSSAGFIGLHCFIPILVFFISTSLRVLFRVQFFPFELVN